MLSTLRIELAAPVNGSDPAAVELAASVDPVCEGPFPTPLMMTVPSPTTSVLLPNTTSVPAAAYYIGVPLTVTSPPGVSVWVSTIPSASN